ncbi:MAG: hypothetical protein H8E44_22645 [Planctomycetes bacterium]|nr:hypothetical protein [Planctomycetota bacterium]MBL7041482.1 hypothetical protein [Pirellulaceae bacterium]
MRWRGRHEWPDRPARPKVRRLPAEERDRCLNTMIRAIERSPVLSALSVEVRALRGRFYVERCYWDEDGTMIGTTPLGRITPLADSAASLLLEVEYRQGTWSEIAKGSVQKVMNAIVNDTKGTFHGLGSLNKSLRKAGKGLERLPVKMRGKARFVFSETGQQCSTQEVLFHYFGMPIAVIAKPRVWYWYHRKPHIIEVSRDRQRVLVRFSTSSLSGEFGGTCLYICRDGKWDAYTIRPNQSGDIASAERWLEKRKWRAWT